MNKPKATKGTPNKIDVHVGNRLKTRRSLLGMSQEKLAEAIGITFQQIQKYERGANRISASRLYEFCKILDTNVGFFYEGLESGAAPYNYATGLSDNAQDDFVDDSMFQSRETIELVKAYYSIKSPDVRKNALKMIRLLAKEEE